MLLLNTRICFILIIAVKVNDAVNQTYTGNYCPKHCFECADRSGCLSDEFYCDGVKECRDGSDEIQFNQTLHKNKGIQCYFDSDRRCFLPKRYVCDNSILCALGEDECNCPQNTAVFQCSSVPSVWRKVLPCQSTGRRRFCDNLKGNDCLDDSDEKPYKKYNSSGFQCQSTKSGFTFTCELPKVYTCDNVSDCDESVDECFCDANEKNSYWNEKCFRCLDKQLVIRNNHLCDGKFHCSDLSDECLCKNKPKICDQICLLGQECGVCSVGQMMCKGESNRTCINRTSVCDGKVDCPLGEDEKMCSSYSSQLFQCADKRQSVIDYKRCDGKPDCPDQSDEHNCSALFKCNSEANSSDFAVPQYAIKCDKVPTCENLEDECNSTICGQDLPEFCKYVEENNGFKCPNNDLTFIGREVCDGYPTCNEASAETSADEMGCPNRFYCEDKGKKGLPIHIDPALKCNGISDCVDESDERNCSSVTHFYCKNNIAPFYIPRGKVCNNNQDCAGGEDECQNCSVSPFSSDQDLISSRFLQVWIWVVGILATIGNLFVFVHTVRMLLKESSLNHMAIINRVLVTQLSMADFMLGIYLLVIGVMNSIYSGTYCRNDTQWRSSWSCTVIGCMSLTSIESSVFLLTTMATVRLLMVTRPYCSSIALTRFVYTSIFCCWASAITLAFIPLSTSLRDYFRSSVWYRNVPFLTLAERHKLQAFTMTLWTLENKQFAGTERSLTWDVMKDSISRLNTSRFVPEHSLGFYSAHGVCLPRFFSRQQDPSWGYSLFLTIVNFVAFIYIATIYMVILRYALSSSKKMGKGTNDSVLALQRKLTRIIVSNGCCWIPICIMAFVGSAGISLSDEVYAVAAIVLLPINSAFNPILYSDLPDIIWRKWIAPTKCGKWMDAKSTTRTSSKALSKNTKTSKMGETEVTTTE